MAVETPNDTAYLNLKLQIQQFFKKRQDGSEEHSRSGVQPAAGREPSRNSQKLSQFITQVSPSAATKAHVRFDLKSGPAAPKTAQKLYYISRVIQAFQVPSAKTAYNKEHFFQSLQAMQFVKLIRPPTQSLINQKRKVLPKKDKYKGTAF